MHLLHLELGNPVLHSLHLPLVPHSGHDYNHQIVGILQALQHMVFYWGFIQILNPWKELVMMELVMTESMEKVMKFLNSLSKGVMMDDLSFLRQL